MQTFEDPKVIQEIRILHDKGMEPVIPYVVDAIQDVMNCFSQYKDYFPVKNLGYYQTDSAWKSKKGIQSLLAFQSARWYIERAKLQAIQDGRWQSRKQLHVDSLLSDLTSDPEFLSTPQWRVFLVKNDLYGTQPDGRLLNFCLGCTRPNAATVISSYRFLDGHNRLNIGNFQTIIQHEFGHILGLTEGDRPHTNFELGPHCTDGDCVMQQRMSGDFSDITQRRLERKSRGLPPICTDCISQGRKTLFRLYANYEKQSGRTSSYNPRQGNPGR